MYIKKIKLENFRNYEKQEVILSPNINVFYGDNAQGKTNIIESIFLCSIGKSFRTSKEKEMIQFGKEFANIEIEYEKKDRSGKVKIQLQEKKNIYLNEIRLTKLSELLGNIHTVIFTPDDIHILKDGPQKRRRFLDIMIGQLRPNYIYLLNRYNKTLEQRNNYLKQIKIEGKKEELLWMWNEKLAEYGEKIFSYRKEFTEKILQEMFPIHKKITNGTEEIELKYQSDCEDKQKFIENLQKTQKIDIIRGFTTKGIHRDDFNIFINGNLVNIYGSQGQNRTVILSLKLAELQVIYNEIGEYPILLLDDFMSELDEKRRNNFLSYTKDTQVVITCTDKIASLQKDDKIYQVNKGEVKIPIANDEKKI